MCSAAGGVEVGHLDLGRAREEAAEVGDAEAALVALVRLVAERADDRIDEDAEAEARLVGVARVVADLDGEDPQRDVDLGSREPGAVRRAHRLDQVVADALELGRAELVVASPRGHALAASDGRSARSRGRSRVELRGSERDPVTG